MNLGEREVPTLSDLGHFSGGSSHLSTFYTFQHSFALPAKPPSTPTPRDHVRIIRTAAKSEHVCLFSASPPQSN